MHSFLHLLSELQNPEKTRNFNVFKNYSLMDFEAQLVRYGVLSNQTNAYRPLRFSVVGTNGKGSTSFYLSEILRTYDPQNTVGLYTSPHLLTPFERIVTNGKNISEDEANEIILSLQKIDKINLRGLSYFECLTLLCFCYFVKKQCKYEIWEAGLGGRLDATKLANAEIIILTKIGIDHSEILGNTLEEIALEKLNIAGPNAKVIYSFPVSGSFRTYLEKAAHSLNLKIKFFDSGEYSNYLQSNFNFVKWVLNDLKLIRSGVPVDFKNFNQPNGRLELISKNPLILFDPAHNPEAVAQTMLDVKKTFGWSKVSLLIGCLPDKDAFSIYDEIQNQAWDKVLFYEAEGFFAWSKHIDLPTGLYLRSSEELEKAIRQVATPVLVLGSFRMYPILTTLYQNDVNL